MSGSVTRDMLTDLQQHFANSGKTSKKGGVVTPGREPLNIQHGPPLSLELPKIGGLPHHLAANGCSTNNDGIGAYAAVTGNGRAVVGYFTCPAVSVRIAALQGVRFGLRELDVDRAEVFVSNGTVAEALRRIAAGRSVRYFGALADHNGIREIARSARRIDIQVRQVDGRGAHLLPEHSLLEITNCLSLSACRLAVHGIPFDRNTHEWLREVGRDSGHRRSSIQNRCDRFIARRDGHV